MNTRSKNDEFLVLIEENKKLIYKVANTYCKNDEDRKDLVQEIIIQMWRAYDSYDSRYKLSTWLYRIALNVAISFYRKGKKKESDSPISEALITSIAEEESKALEENIKLLYEFINELDELNKALMLLYLEENSYKEIADVLGITETNVATKIGRIKEKLKKRFSVVNE